MTHCVHNPVDGPCAACAAPNSPAPSLTAEQLVEEMNVLLNRASAVGHHVADLGDLALGVALRYYAAAGYSPADVRALLLARLRTCMKGGGWDIPS